MAFVGSVPLRGFSRTARTQTRRMAVRASADVRLVGISGSLRRTSTNTGILRYLAATPPAGATLELVDISEFPVYNGDIEAAGVPACVVRAAEQVAAADGIIFAAPEYNYDVAAPLTNAHAWLSRSGVQGVFAGKAGGVVSSAGGLGGARAQTNLRTTCIFLQVHLVVGREVLIRQFEGEKKFSPDGDLIDPKWQERVTEYAERVVALARKLRD